MRKKLRVNRIIFLIVLILVVVVVVMFLNKKEKILMPNLKELKNEQITKFIEDNQLILKKEIVDIDNCPKNKVYEQSIKENSLINPKDKIVIKYCSGKNLAKIYSDNNVDELGRIPIMMYHGIVDKKNSETNYTNGNVDKDGYNRTAEAFIADLEFYYKQGYRMIRLIDYVSGTIDVELGKSPIILTFDDGNVNNIKVTGIDKNGEIIIDPNSAIGILEQFKKKYPDFNVTATFFLNGGLFKQKQYNEQILNWLIKNGYDVGNHSYSHVDFTKISQEETEREIGKMYNLLNNYIKGKYVNIVSLPFGSPYKTTHENFEYILKGKYDNINYSTVSTLRVGYEPDYSPFSSSFDSTFIKRVRAYDNEGLEFDIKATFDRLEQNKYISDGNKEQVVVKKEDKKYIKNLYDKKLIEY